MGDIVDITPRVVPKLIKRYGSDGPMCFHGGNVFVDVAQRILECATCKAHLDPIEYLGRMASDSVYRHLSERAETEMDELLEWLYRVHGSLRVSPDSAVTVQVPLPSGKISHYRCTYGKPGAERVRRALEEIARRYEAGGFAVLSDETSGQGA